MNEKDVLARIKAEIKEEVELGEMDEDILVAIESASSVEEIATILEQYQY